MQYKIERFRTEPLKEAHYVHAHLARYTQNGVEKSWEVVEAHDSVAVLIYHTQKEAFVLVRQFRPAVYMHDGKGVTIELCAGIADKALPPVQIAVEEIEEECGYSVPLEAMERITSFYTSVGFAGSRQTLFYAEVDESMHTSEGGGIDDEEIEVLYLPVNEAMRFLYDESIAKTPGLMFAFMWWREKNAERFLVKSE